MKHQISQAAGNFYLNRFTRIKTEPFASKVTTEDSLYFAGSCFAENLSRYWKDNFLPAVLSLFGSSYNPASLRDGFSLLCGGDGIKEEELFCHKELWRHSLFDTAMTDTDRSLLYRRINRELATHRTLLAAADHLVLTLGTAFVYEDRKNGRIVNNCHKRSRQDFRRYALSADEISSALTELTSSVRSLNPGIRLILSLSPVRHLRDKGTENSLSKALLRCGMEEFLKTAEKAVYFPSYEIMLDELRDYRWYAEDMCHPSEEAVGYIMERFCEASADEDLREYLVKAGALRQILNHRILHPGTSESKSFIKQKAKKIQDFRERYPFACIYED